MKNEEQLRQQQPVETVVYTTLALSMFSLIVAAFSKASRQEILNRSRGRSELNGAKPSALNPLQAAHKPYFQTGVTYKNHPDYDHPDSGYAILTSQHAKQHIELAENAENVDECLRNIEAAILVMKGWGARIKKNLENNQYQ
jgi:hypothetical protein